MNASYSGRDSYYRRNESILHLTLREGDWKVALLLLRKGAKVRMEEFAKLPAAVVHQQRVCAENRNAECEEFRQIMELMASGMRN